MRSNPASLCLLLTLACADKGPPPDGDPSADSGTPPTGDEGGHETGGAKETGQVDSGGETGGGADTGQLPETGGETGTPPETGGEADSGETEPGDTGGGDTGATVSALGAVLAGDDVLEYLTSVFGLHLLVSGTVTVSDDEMTMTGEIAYTREFLDGYLGDPPADSCSQTITLSGIPSERSCPDCDFAFDVDAVESDPSCSAEPTTTYVDGADDWLGMDFLDMTWIYGDDQVGYMGDLYYAYYGYGMTYLYSGWTASGDEVSRSGNTITWDTEVSSYVASAELRYMDSVRYGYGSYLPYPTGTGYGGEAYEGEVSAEGSWAPEYRVDRWTVVLVKGQQLGITLDVSDDAAACPFSIYVVGPAQEWLVSSKHSFPCTAATLTDGCPAARIEAPYDGTYAILINPQESLCAYDTAAYTLYLAEL